MYKSRYVTTPVQRRRIKADLESFKQTTKDFDKSAGKDIKAFEAMREDLVDLGLEAEAFKVNASSTKLLSQQWQDMKSSTPPADVERQTSTYALDRLNPSFYNNAVTVADDLIKAIAKFVQLFDVDGGYTVEMDN